MASLGVGSLSKFEDGVANRGYVGLGSGSVYFDNSDAARSALFLVVLSVVSGVASGLVFLLLAAIAIAAFGG